MSTRRWLSWCLGVCLALLVALPQAIAATLDFKSIGAEPAVFYDAPTVRGRKLFVAPRGMPVEVILTQADWVRVREATGELAWVEKKALSDKRTVVSLAAATVRAAPEPNAVPVFRVAKSVVLELLEPGLAGWVKVKHADGSTGYINAAEVWGE